MQGDEAATVPSHRTGPPLADGTGPGMALRPAGGGTGAAVAAGSETLQQPLWDDVELLETAAEARGHMYRQAVEEVRKSGKASISCSSAVCASATRLALPDRPDGS